VPEPCSFRAEETQQIAFGEPAHLGRFVDPKCQHLTLQQGALQMTGTVTNFKDPVSLDERQHAQNPVFPSAHGDRGRDQIVGEGKLVIEQAKE